MRAPGRRRDSSGSISPAGDVKGWWWGSQRPSSSFHSTSGQSTIQVSAWAPSGISPSLSPSRLRSSASTAAETRGESATRTRTSPSEAPSALVGGGDLALGEELRDGRAPAAVLDHGPDQALRAQLLRLGDEPVELRAGEVVAAGVQRPDQRTVLDRPPERLELALGEDVGQLGELQAEAQVRAVGAEAGDGVGVGEPRQRQLHLDPGRAEHGGEQALVDLDHVVHVDERHLDVELGEVGLAVGAEGPRRGSSGRSGSSARSRRPSGAA